MLKLHIFDMHTHMHTYTYARMHTTIEYTGSKLFNSVVKEDPIHKLI